MAAVLLYGSYARGFFAVFAEEDAELGEVLLDFYVKPGELELKFDAADRVVQLVYTEK